jgi:V/A-type H+-transporting ATPase subunit B
MGFEMSEWDHKLLRYGVLFEQRIMDLSVNIRLFEALDRCWEILAECFEPAETGIRRSILDRHWPQPEHSGPPEEEAAPADA